MAVARLGKAHSMHGANILIYCGWCGMFPPFFRFPKAPNAIFRVEERSVGEGSGGKRRRNNGTETAGAPPR